MTGTMVASGAVRYHIGFLMRDRLFNRDANTMAHKMQRLQDNGGAHLVQRRLSEGVYEYWAVPRKPRSE